MNSTIHEISMTTNGQQDDGHVLKLNSGHRVLLTVLIVQTIVTCVGNALTMIVVYKDSALRTMGNAHVVSLASADFIAGVTGFFDILWFITEDVNTFLNSCKFCCVFWYNMFFISFAASLFSMTLIALDRWIFIAYPLRYYIWITPLKTTVMIGLSWTSAILFGLLPVSLKTFDTMDKCGLMGVVTNAYITYGIGGILFCSCTISFVFYFKIFLIIRKLKRSTQAQDGFQGHSRSRCKEIKILFLVCCITFVCWVPFYIQNLPHMPIFSNEISNLILSLCLFNSCVNFFLYSAKNADFRKSFLKLFPRIKRN